MSGTATIKGGSFAICPFAFQGAAPAIGWTALVALAGIILSGHVAATGLLALAVVAGLPHGTGDIGSAQRSFRQFGRTWWVPFLLGYLALVAVTLVAWSLLPATMLIVFLLLSIAHFGAQDVRATSCSSDWVAIITHGGVPIIVPALFHYDEVTRLFAVLIGEQAGAVSNLLAGPVACIWALAVAATVFDSLRRKGTALPGIADLALVGVLFAVAPPLVAFALYFALLHTPRAFFAHRGEGTLPSPVQMAGLTALGCGLGLAIFHFGPHLSTNENVVRTSFLLLSALTVPHMALGAIEQLSTQKETAHG